MSGFDPSALTLVQCVLAGAVLALCVIHWGWWRGELRQTGAPWTVAWSVVLAAVCLSNGLADVAPSESAREALLLVRFVTTGAAVVLTVPAVAAHAGRSTPRTTRRLLAALTLWYACAVVLWLTTDLVHVPATGGEPAGYGPLASAVLLVPLAVTGLYVAHMVGGRPLTAVGAILAVAGSVSSVLLIASTVIPSGTVAEVLAGLWAAPLVLGLQVFSTTGIAVVRRDAMRRARMRDAVATVANAAWFVKAPEDVLARGVAEVRRVLDDELVEGSLRPLARHRFVAEFSWPDGRRPDPDTQSFLRDMSRVVSSAAERHALTVRLRQAAFTDSLTDLHNRHGLDRYLTQALERAVVEQTRVAVLFCDLDGLKLANDRHGHAWGDALLVRTAEHLRQVVGPETFVARHGGDEFVVVLERVGADADVQAVARRVRDEFETRDDDVGSPSISVGVATWEPRDVVDVGALVRAADLAMLEAKRTHTGIRWYDEELHSRVAAEDELRRALEAGIRAGDIVAHFQPLIDARTLEVVGLEVLARWRHGGRLRKPEEWLGFAERTGLVVEVGRQMFVAARRGMEEFDLPVSVNVAVRQLEEPDFVEQVEAAWGGDAWDRLTIEVTESALLFDAAHVREALGRLAARGAKIAIDDFGTGYNSLSRLGELPLDVLKIDRTFVHDVERPEGAAILRAILALADAHGLSVVAEGVERAHELTTLVEMGVGTVQGFLVGRPGPTAPVAGPREKAAAQQVAARHRAGVLAARKLVGRAVVPRPALQPGGPLPARHPGGPLPVRRPAGDEAGPQGPTPVDDADSVASGV